MRQAARAVATVENARLRLATLARIAPEGFELLENAAKAARTVPARHEISRDGQAIGHPLLLLSGWACRTRTLIDGRRQILGFVLPGELLGYAVQDQDVALVPLAAITELIVCPAPTFPPGHDGHGLEAAYAASNTLDREYLFAQITRLGRMSALERITDWMLELHERLSLAGLVHANSFHLPVTQELIADALGMTSVHVNRTLQVMRREGLLELHGGTVTLLEPGRMAAMVGAVSPMRRTLHRLHAGH